MELSTRAGVNSRVSETWIPASNQYQMGRKALRMSVFDEKYRVVGIEGDRLLLRGVHSGAVLTILNSEPEVPLTQEEYPIGRLIALTDPAIAPGN